jgi:RND family efflux transporter MFP subunit
MSGKSGASRLAWILVVSLAVATVVTTAVVVVVLKDRKLPRNGVKPLPVRVMDVAPRAVEHRVMLPGRVEPVADVRLATQRPGMVAEVLVDKGAEVKTGDRLLSLDRRLAQHMAQRAELELADAEREWARWQELQRSGAVSSSDVDRVRMRLDLARVARAESVVNLSHTEVTAPTNGVIVERHAEVGEHLAEGHGVLRLVTVNPVKVRIDVPERDIGGVTEGQSVPVVVSALGRTVVTGIVTFVSRQASRQSNTFAAEVEVANPGGRLRPGMLVEASVRRAEWPSALLVPLSAVVPRKGEHVVYLVEGDRAVRRIVRIEAILDQQAVLAEGLKAGDRIVVEGQRWCSDGQLIEVRP